MRRADKQIADQNEIDGIIRQSRVCRLAMADGDQPYVVPLNFGYDPPCLFFHSADQGRKLDILRKNPKVCFAFDHLEKIEKDATACDWGAAFVSVIGEGTAQILEGAEEKVAGLKAIMAQYSNRSFDFPLESLEKTAVIRVTISSMTGKRSG